MGAAQMGAAPSAAASVYVFVALGVALYLLPPLIGGCSAAESVHVCVRVRRSMHVCAWLHAQKLQQQRCSRFVCVNTRTNGTAAA